jgi:ABC-type cobalamin/Fe3+-siderophores transport system ATPase subunit
MSRRNELPKAIVPFRCADKLIEEKWTAERAEDLANIPSPFRAILVGGCGSGKSTVAKQLLIHQKPNFDELILIHADVGDDEHQGGSTEWWDADPTLVMNECPSLEFWTALCANDDPDRPVKRLVVVDDLEQTSALKQRLKNLALLFRYVSTHKSMSVILCHQSMFDIMPLLRKMANLYIVWKPRAKNELTLIENRVGLDKGVLKELFTQLCPNQRDSITIDLTDRSPQKLRLNLWTPIDLEEDD